MGAYGFWSATAAGLWLTGISLACMAIWVGRQFARDDNHTPEEIETGDPRAANKRRAAPAAPAAERADLDRVEQLLRKMEQTTT